MMTVLRMFESYVSPVKWENQQPTTNAWRIPHPKKNLLEFVKSLNASDSYYTLCDEDKVSQIVDKLLRGERVDTAAFGGHGYGLELIDVI